MLNNLKYSYLKMEPNLDQDGRFTQRTKKSKRGIDYDPKRLPNLHADFINPLPCGRGIELQHKSRTGVLMRFEEWMSTIGINAFRHANCCKIAYEAGQQSRQAEIDEQQKRIEELESKLKATDALGRMRAAVIGAYKTQGLDVRTKRKMLILKQAEQKLKGGEYEK